MAKYMIYYTAYASYEVEAETEEEAIDIAQDRLCISDFMIEGFEVEEVY